MSMRYPGYGTPVNGLRVIYGIYKYILFREGTALPRGGIFSGRARGCSYPGDYGNRVRAMFRCPGGNEGGCSMGRSCLSRTGELFVFLFILVPLSSFFSVSTRMVKVAN